LKDKEERRRERRNTTKEEWCTVALVSLEASPFSFSLVAPP
jgi:hypothetical protein